MHSTIQLIADVSAFNNDAGYVTQADIDASLVLYALTTKSAAIDLTNYALKSEHQV